MKHRVREHMTVLSTFHLDVYLEVLMCKMSISHINTVEKKFGTDTLHLPSPQAASAANVSSRRLPTAP